jgi:hypothetical protein
MASIRQIYASKRKFTGPSEVQKACFEAFNLASLKDVGDYVARRLKEKASTRWASAAGLGHLVGSVSTMFKSVRWSSRTGWSWPLEPRLFPRENLGIRSKIRPHHQRRCEVLTAAVPKEFVDIEAL